MSSQQQPSLPGFRELFAEYVVQSSNGDPKLSSKAPAWSGSNTRAQGHTSSTPNNAHISQPSSGRPPQQVHSTTSVSHRGTSTAQTLAAPPNPSVSLATPRVSSGRTNTHDHKPYECETCMKRFSRPSALATHENVHTGDKPFQCDWPGCDKLFSTKSNMCRHSHIHPAPANNTRMG